MWKKLFGFTALAIIIYFIYYEVRKFMMVKNIVSNPVLNKAVHERAVEKNVSYNSELYRTANFLAKNT